MENATLVERVQELTDLELAILMSLVVGQHCIIQTDAEHLESLQQELQLIAANTFGLSHTLTECNGTTSQDEFTNGVLGGESKAEASLNDESRVPNIVFIKGLPAANEQIQIQALELLRTRRIFTHVSVHSAPKQFLIVFITANCDAKLTHHLNDQIFISHTHDPEEGFQNLEEEWSEREEDDGASTSSVIHRKATEQSFPAQHPLFGAEDIRAIADQSDKVTITAEILAYLHNIIVFLRLNRAVRGGVSPRATEHFRLLVKCLAPLHGLDYVTPSLIPLAARKVYPHRIVITKPENERSMQYGSDLRAVAAMLEGIGPSDVVETVLEEVEMPL